MTAYLPWSDDVCNWMTSHLLPVTEENLYRMHFHLTYIRMCKMCIFILHLHVNPFKRWPIHIQSTFISVAVNVFRRAGCVLSYLVRLALQRSIRGDSGLWSLLPPGAEAGAARVGALLGDDPTLREWEYWEDTDRWGEWGGRNGQGRALCSWRTTGQENNSI